MASTRLPSGPLQVAAVLMEVMEDSVPTFWIGHHDDKRQKRVLPELIQQAHSAGYDMVTSSITTDLFHSRVLALLSSTQAHASHADGHANPCPSETPQRVVVPSLAPVDTDLIPDESMSHIVATTSSWTDLCSSDPLVADVSKQVLMLEIAYAAFCGVSYVLIPGPRLYCRSMKQVGLMQYARAVQEALATGTYMQIKIWFPMIDHPENEVPRMGDLAPFARSEYFDDDPEGDGPGLDLYGTWDAWNAIRSFCNYHTRLCVALNLPKHLPPVNIQARWYSEPVKLLTIESTSFTKNPKGYPVLSKPHQTLINRYMRLRVPPWMLLCNVDPISGNDDFYREPDSSMGLAATLTLPGLTASFPTLAEAAQEPRQRNNTATPHLAYLRNLQKKQPPQSQLEKFGSGYQDYLQAPLQPLAVNLESITYEVFEKDPVKYDWYEKAIARALHDWIEQGKPTSNPDGRLVVAVVGAGRGPLVTRALRASDDVGIEIDMWALEKNPNAFVLLQHHNANPEIWASRVKLVKSDMRTWRGPWRKKESGPRETIGQALGPELPKSSVLTDPLTLEAPSCPVEVEYCHIDILISELLGSFADNELSPECLDGVQHLLNPVHGISIPASYSAHLTPIASPKLNADINAQALSNPHAAKTPYVVMLHAIDYLSSTTSPSPADSNNPANPSQQPPSSSPIVQKAWSFAHPNHQLSDSQLTSNSTSTADTLHPVTAVTNSHNTRHTTLTFPIPHRGTIHGLAGYFEAVLYGNVELSTNPLTMDQKSEGMISWFPVYFPLQTPIYAPSASDLVVNMWRQTDDRKVWYEWIVEVFAPDTASPQPDSSSVAAPCLGSGHHGKGKEKEGRWEGEGEGTQRTRRIGTKKVRIAMTELHSSIKDACLM